MPSKRHIATGIGRLAQEPAGDRILAATAAHPRMVAGTGRFCTDLAAATGGCVVGKVGALGLYVALNRETGEALAVKDTSGGRLQIVEAAAAHLVGLAGWLSADEAKALAKHRVPVLTNWSGGPVGAQEPVFEVAYAGRPDPATY